MAPCPDVYVRLPHLDRLRLESFLDAHVTSWRESAAWLSENASDILRAGLSGSPSGETLYASPSSGVRDTGLSFVMLAFPRDSGVVLGVSVDLEPDEDAAMTMAEKWLVRLMRELGAPQGFVQAEEPPPLTEAEWQVEMARALSSRSGS
ncbi:hypothetical protein [Lentzea atacamensis]|uniref:hypothetical protein n=1 Tax=Lentzea atacamensis TaxID=531938 RepID=UPI000DD34E9F|nr:hypothetical protein [Lentzea atacamensis]